MKYKVEHHFIYGWDDAGWQCEAYLKEQYRVVEADRYDK